MFCHSGHILATKLRHWVSSSHKYNNYEVGEEEEEDGTVVGVDARPSASFIFIPFYLWDFKLIRV